MSTIFRCIKCSYAVHGDRRAPWPCPCKGKYERMEQLDDVPGTPPPHVHTLHTPAGEPFYLWYRSWHGDFSWEAGSETQWLVRIPPPDQEGVVDFINAREPFKGAIMAHLVSCPTCRAKAGVQCVRPSEHQVWGKSTHLERRNKADAIIHWQYGAGAQFAPGPNGKRTIVRGEDHVAELQRLQIMWRAWEAKALAEHRALHERTVHHNLIADRKDSTGQFDLFLTEPSA